jgi:acetyltransferase-like isoleucine patch superfamily enzyme
LIEVRLTREDANTEFAIVAEWLVADAEAVTRAQPVCVIETTKATVEVEAPGQGTLVHLFDVGAEVELGGVVGLIAETDAELKEARTRARPPVEAGPVSGTKATRKARELAQRHDIDLDEIDKRGFITTSDVEAVVLAKSTGQTESKPAPMLVDLDLSGVSLPESWADAGSRGALDSAFLSSLREDPDSFRRLPSDEKCARYRAHGAIIGDGVSLGEDSLLVTSALILDDGVQIGARARVECAEAFCVGALTHIGPDLEVRCRRACIGANVHAGRSIRIGGGGHRDPRALVAVGDLAFLGDEIFVNACRPVLIGRETFITQRSMIVTHNIGHSVLEGYENRFAPVVVEDFAQVGLAAVIYAGCRVGEGAIVASNSYVVSDIPAGKLAIGVPARATGEARVRLSLERRVDLAQQLIDDFYELLALSGHDPSWLTSESARCFALTTTLASGRVAFVEHLRGPDQLPEPSSEGDSVVLTLSLDTSPAPEGWTVLDLVGRELHGSGGALADATREFCRKRGIRFAGEPWRYSGDLI